ncbi:MAG: DUF547 domain-containing protein [Gammaproteobacteria bacterium]|nr:DUF547 domain-containing protein [Gammaproteobacteria bacterium]QOJ32511.1 MAG: DUF547 domain-containing protein [Gammaproteobacteria bacterium]
MPRGQIIAGRGFMRALGLLAVLVLALAAPAGRAAAPDYALLEEALLQNVRDGYVDYDGIADNPKFARFVTDLATAQAPTERNEALAFYINAYNAFAIQGILQGHTPDSSSGRRRFFGSLKFGLGGGKVTLEEIEQQRLRPFGDPRAQLALARAALSGPRLSSHAYLPGTLDAQLDAASRRFVNDVSRNRFDIARRTAFLSPLFDWHRSDFEAAAGSLPGWLARHVDEPASRAALLEGRLALRYLDFDWDLNGRYAGPARP